MSKRWTPAEDAAMRILVDAGRGPAEVAEALQRSIASIKNYASDKKIRFKAREDRHKAAMAKRSANPAYRAKLSAAAHKRYRDNPGLRDHLRQKAIENNAIAIPSAALQTPKGMAARAAGNKRRGERQLAWCPAHRRDEYRALIRKNLGREEARRIMVESFTPFERQLAKAQQFGIAERVYVPASDVATYGVADYG